MTLFRGKAVKVETSRATLYLAKAQEFAKEARTALEAGRFDATLLLAIHAGISAADAVAVALRGSRSADPDHRAAADLLRSAGRGAPAFDARARQLVALINKKNTVEYEARRSTREEGQDALLRAERFVEWATALIDRTVR